MKAFQYSIFYDKYLVDRGDVDVECCPPEKMIADFFTKPLQGSLILKFREDIMGHSHLSSVFDPQQNEIRRVSWIK